MMNLLNLSLEVQPPETLTQFQYSEQIENLIYRSKMETHPEENLIAFA